MTKRLDGPSAAVRIRVMKRDRFACTYCGVPGTDAELEIDHIVAVANGGSHHISNLTTACRACNQMKGKRAMTPSQPSQPRRDQSGLIGMFLHAFDDDETIRYQGQIIGLDGDSLLVQLFSWFDGCPTIVKPMERPFIYSDKVKLYADQELFHYGYQNYCAKRKALRDPLYENHQWMSFEKAKELFR